MRKFTILLSLWMCFSATLFAQKPIYTKAKVTAAIVYKYSAGLESTTNVEIPQGASEIVIGNIADQISEETLQLEFSSRNITVLSSQFTTNYTTDFEADKTNPNIKKVMDSIEIVRKLISNNRIELEANQKTIELLDKNQTVLSGSQSSSSAQLTQLADYYTKKRIELSTLIERLKTNGELLDKKIIRLNNSLKTQEEKEFTQFSSGVLVLKINTPKAESVKINIKYLALNASWSPHYEINGNSIKEPLGVIFKAMVKQKTGLDWKGVKLTLINGVPNKNRSAPELNPWFLNASEKTIAQFSQQYKKSALMSAKVSESDNLDEVVIINRNTTNFTSNQHMLNESYEVDIPYDILSNNKDHLIALSHQKIPATFDYFTAPNYNREAFLVAKIKDFSQYNLIAASANIIFENIYIGETQINPNLTEDLLQITLGTDHRISIKRENIKDKSGEKFLSSLREKTITYDLIIKNNKKEVINILVKDRFPISNNENIKVELLEKSGAEIEEEKGYLSWDLKISPNDTKKLHVSFKVRYPKDININNL